MVVLVLALIVFGPAKLPELMGSVGHAIREFQRASRELTDVFQETQQEFQSALDLDEQPAAATAEAADGDEVIRPATVAEEAAYPTTPPAEAPAQPEELETAAAMIDPVEPLPVPAAAAAATVGLADAAAKPKRPRRRKTAVEGEPLAEAAGDQSADEPAVAEAAGEPAPTPRPPRRRSRSSAAEDGVPVDPSSAADAVAAPTEPSGAELTTTAAAPAEPSSAELTTTTTAPAANGSELHEPADTADTNGSAPAPRRRRRAAAAPGAEEHG